MIHSKTALLVSAFAVIATAISKVQAADPTTADCLAANENAIKLRGQHRLRAAREQLLVCAAASCPADVRTECARKVEDVNRAVPTIVFETTDGNGNDVSSVKVTMDGQPLVDRLEGTALSLDPGEHKFTFELSGSAPVIKTIVLREAEKGRRERIVLGGDVPPPQVASAGPVMPGAANELAPDRTPDGGRGQRTIGLALAGIGVAALTTGGIFGVLAGSGKRDYEQHCGSNIGAPPGYCDPDGVSDHDSAQSKATISTVMFAVGGVAAATGAAVFFTAPRLSSSAQVSVGLGEVILRGRF